MYRLAQLSDPHIPPLPPVRLRELLNKRLLGYVSWRLRRHRSHRREILDALTQDLRSAAPDHVVVTGDLVNLGLPSEFIQAAAWLQAIGGPDWISVIPGNHDAYTSADPAVSWRPFAAYAVGDGVDGTAGPQFPYVRHRGPIELIGLSTAVASLPGYATGVLGAAQLAALDSLLGELGDRDRCRIILIHHPPIDGVSHWRRRLIDAADFRAVIARHGAQLVLHGHEHHRLHGEIDSRHGKIPVIGAASASKLDDRPDAMAQYHVFAIDRSNGHWRIDMERRRFEPATAGFAAERFVISPRPA